MHKAMERYRETLGKQGGAGSAFLDLMEQVERNPDRYLEQGRSFFNRSSADDLRRALELQRSKDPVELVEREGTSLERRLQDAQDRIARQQAEIDELRAALEDLRRSKPGEE
jgi:hypothetical protein